jgi:hypothetical protein
MDATSEDGKSGSAGSAASDSPDQPDACGRCTGHLGWIDDAWMCSTGCTYCADCKDELGGLCPNCSEMLHRIQRTRRIGRGLGRP